MHIPPYYKRRGFQYFFVGVIIGAIISYLIFLYFYGEMTEAWIEENIQLRDQIEELENDIENISKDNEDLTKQSQQNLTLQEIQIEIENPDKLKLDRFMQHDLKEQMKSELNSLKGRDIESLYENQDLLEAAIENKSYRVEDFSYDATIKKLWVINSTLFLTIELEVSST
ncbi:sporulation membrane protein YtrI [Salinibacillus xinjiangensis]|uniref:Sporulation membrane protein YtrI C-terminal domain-containing protein n=1 Tax=Salinibacillus xinjiangensis TaxID=1229268 RepID=A0A6G1X9J7_9BACI|nr:sporulation membrane protein YtrI [Salinibacillus xinjiangensis]MRG87691.1 hypothetical protein [Salinibacillus xinjiangensis]